MSRTRPHLVGLAACGVGYTPHRDGATRRAVSTQLVGNPVCAHYRRHVTPGVCRRGGTLRRGFPRPEPSHGRIIQATERVSALVIIRPRRVPESIRAGAPVQVRVRSHTSTRAGVAVCGGARSRENAAHGR